MKVQCSLCSFEENGRCTKKTRDGNPVAVNLNKRRKCELYSEDATRVLAKYRKTELHRQNLMKNQLRRQQLIKALETAKREGVKAFSEDK